MASPRATGSLMLLKDIVFVLVTKIVPPLTATPAVVADVAAIVTIAVARSARASITPVAAVGVFLEHSMSQIKIWSIVFHIIAASIFVLIVFFEKVLAGTRSFRRGAFAAHGGTSITASITHETWRFSKFQL